MADIMVSYIWRYMPISYSDHTAVMWSPTMKDLIDPIEKSKCWKSFRFWEPIFIQPCVFISSALFCISACGLCEDILVQGGEYHNGTEEVKIVVIRRVETISRVKSLILAGR